MRAGLTALLAEEGVEVAGAWPTFESWARDRLAPASDVLLLDPGSTTEIEEGAAVAPLQPIVVLGPVSDEGRLIAALSGRPWGYLPRDASGERLAAAVRAVSNGLVALDPEMASRVVGRAVLSSDDAGDELTPREREVLQLIAMGLSNKAIASRLAISEHTVKFHVASILGRLGATSRTDAVRIGARRGLVVL